MIPLAIPNLSGNERKYLNDCIDSTFVSSVGEYVNRIEEMSAELTGTSYGVATSAGTTALHTALLAVGVKPGDIVIAPSFTFIATANAISHAGAKPWFIDINPESWTIDIDQLEDELSRKTVIKEMPCDDGKLIKKLVYKETNQCISAIMPVYTLGNIPDMDRLKTIAFKYSIPIVADAAAAIGSTYKGKKVGELSDLTALSFNGNKTVTAGGGGMIVGNDENLLKLCKHLSTTARVSAEYDFDMVGYNYRMTNLQAAVGVAQLEQLDAFVKRKREVREYYNQAFKDIDKVKLFVEPDYCKSSCWFSGIVLEKGNLDMVRKLCSYLKDNGIEARSFWKPVHLQIPYLEALKADDLSVTEGLWDRIITLPCSTNISDGELEYVEKYVRKGLDVLY
ncbi:MAG: aminotransferase class I/II-fold pyridoxal phosphate-dependent enzyme [Eubacterium sp.]|nr:aminotransferase class I/II-fold pyridoxal phosphate-dependent enzyme [Eubacterium sp.]